MFEKCTVCTAFWPKNDGFEHDGTSYIVKPKRCQRLLHEFFMFLEMCFFTRASSYFDNYINSLTWHKFEPGKSKNGIALKKKNS